MKKPDVIVETIHSISPVGEERISALKQTPSPPITVRLHGDQLAHLDMSMSRSKAWAGILDSVQRMKQAVYLKIDLKTRMIAELLLPRPVKVASVKSANRKGDVEVELIISAARHYLRRTNPDYKNLLKTVENAQKTGMPVLVTESRDRHEIVDVRPLPETMAAPTYLDAPLPGPAAAGGLPTILNQPRSGTGGAK